MTQILGRCLCGAVRFQLAAEPVMTAIRHCTHCQLPIAQFPQNPPAA